MVRGWQCEFQWRLKEDEDLNADITYTCSRPEGHREDYHYDQRLDQHQRIMVSDTRTELTEPKPFHDPTPSMLGTRVTTISEEAENLVAPGGDRAQTYGGPGASFSRISELWSAYLDHPLTARDVAHMMILLKVSRTKDAYHRDSYVDIVGYSRCVEMMQDGQADRPVSSDRSGSEN